MNEKNLQWVFIECPIQQWSNFDVQFWHSQYINTKRRGFEKEYPAGVLPFGNYDFIADILMVVEMESKTPLCVLKSINQERCKKFHLEFELNAHLKSDYHKPHREYVNQQLARAETEGFRMGYTSSWTLLPEARTDRSLRQTLHEMTTAILYHYHRTYQVPENLAVCSNRFKVPETHGPNGYEVADNRAGPLAPMISPFLFGEKSTIMLLREFTPLAQTIALKYQSYFDTRLEFKVPATEVLKEAA